MAHGTARTPRSSTYLDSSGRALTDYPRPSVAVDAAILTVTPQGVLSAVTVRRASAHRRDERLLPGTFLHSGERLIDAARRAVADKIGATMPTVGVEQLRTFDEPDRDERGWVLSVAHLVVVAHARIARLSGDDVALVPVDDPGPLAFDHAEIVQLATARVRSAHDKAPDPYGLLEEPFTLLDLQRLHEQVAGRPVVKDTFRRRMLGMLEPTGETREGAVGKPARLWRRAAGDVS